MAPDLVRPHGFIDPGVEDKASIIAPGQSVVGVGNG